MEETKYTTRYVSRIILEAETPLAIGSGKKDLLTDALVATDVNGMPFIPGTSIAGVIRSACKIGKNDKTPFGFQLNDDGQGSRIIFSDGVMIGKDGQPDDGLKVIDMKDSFYSHFKTLPIRQHVRINSKGSTDNGVKFDEQVVFKGTRFCFDMELLSTGSEEDANYYAAFLNALHSSTFRIGSGTQSGFGLMKVISLRRRNYDLTRPADLESYAARSASLAAPFEGATEMPTTHAVTNNDWQQYTLKLQPKDFFLFGSGMGDDEADITPVSEAFIQWTDGKPHFHERGILIPATSVKGALAHRTAYHWNRLKQRFADGSGDKPLTGDNNEAVVAIFGKSGQNDKEIKRGNIMLSDVILNTKAAGSEKIFNHVSIDRFTGGSIDGALFTEKVTKGCGQETEITLTIDVPKDSIADETICKAFEMSLQDIADGLLPLGGGVNRGNGIFTGTWTKED